MQDEQLKNTLSDDIDDLLRQVESSFDIQFGQCELQHVKTFGELCDIIESKIRLADTRDCTSQQAFYKLRKALAVSTATLDIAPASELAHLLPRRTRKIIWRSVEHQLGFKLNIIGISSTAAVFIFFSFLISFAAFFLSAQAAGIGLAVSALGAIIANRTGNSLELKTVRACVEKITREHYSKSRRNPNTFNRNEIAMQVQAIFMDGLGLPISAFNREATFV